LGRTVSRAERDLLASFWLCVAEEGPGPRLTAIEEALDELRTAKKRKAKR
jgi:hypothetical protein